MSPPPLVGNPLTTPSHTAETNDCLPMLSSTLSPLPLSTPLFTLSLHPSTIISQRPVPPPKEMYRLCTSPYVQSVEIWYRWLLHFRSSHHAYRTRSFTTQTKCQDMPHLNWTHSEWSFPESHHLLEGLVWHHRQPFRQEILILRHFNKIKKRLLEPNFLNYINDETLS